jgi:hypothetical protein
MVTNSSFGFLTGIIDFSFSKLFGFLFGLFLNCAAGHFKKGAAILPAKKPTAARVRTEGWNVTSDSEIYSVLVSAATRDSPSPKKLKRICDRRFTEQVDRQGRTRREMAPFSKEGAILVL